MTKKITNPDITNEDPKYWEEVLRSHGLGIASGYSPRFISYAGDINALEQVSEIATHQDQENIA